jgi:hypothetical protein
LYTCFDFTWEGTQEAQKAQNLEPLVLPVFLFSIQVPEKLFGTLRPPELRQGSFFDLPDSFAGKMHLGADLSECLRILISEPEAALDNHTLFLIKLREQRL